MTRAFVFLSLVLAAATHAQSIIPNGWSPERIVMPQATREGSDGRVPNIASDGQNFLVVSSRENLLWSVEQIAMLVGPDGSPILPFSYYFESAMGTHIGVASSGRRYLLAWGGGGETFIALIDSDGRLLTSPSIRIHESTRIKNFRADLGGNRPVAWTGEHFLVLTTIEKNVKNDIETELIGTRVSETGDVVGPEISFGSRIGIDIASLDGRTVVLSRRSGLELQTLDRNGTISAASTIAGASGAAAIAAGPDGFEVIWQTAAGSVRGQRLDSAGVAVGEPQEIFTTSRHDVDVTWVGDGYLASCTTAEGVEIAHLTGTGNTVPLKTVVSRREHAENAAVGWNGTTELVAFGSWTGVYAKEANAQAVEIAVHRAPLSQAAPMAAMTADAVHVALVDRGVVLRRGDSFVWLSACTHEAPAIAAGPSSSLVVWSECGGIVRASIGDGGNVALGSGGSPYAVWTGKDFAVLWINSGLLHQARVSVGGEITMPDRVIGSPQSRFAVAASASKILVVWNGGGVLLDGESFVNTASIVSSADSPWSLSVASDGSDFLVTWINKTGARNDYVAGRRVNNSGIVDGATVIYSDGGDEKLALQTFWTGSNFLTVWSVPTDGYRSESDLWALRIAPDGRLIDYPAKKMIRIAGEVSSWAFNGQLAVAYTSNIGGPFGGLERAFYRITETPRIRGARMR